MRIVILSLFWLAFCLPISAQVIDNEQEFDGANCTSIMVGKKASADGSVIVSHTCDGRYRTWMTIEPAQNHKPGTMHKVFKGTMHTAFPADTQGVKFAGEIPQVAHTYAYLNTAYPCLNEKQLAIGETTFSGPDTLVNSKGLFLIEELERVALMRCATAREAVKLIGSLVQQYGYGDGGECITIADKKEIWQMEILGEGPEKIGGVWAAQRIPDDHVGVSANIPRIGKMQRDNPEYFMASDNVEEVALKYGLWDGKEPFVFWKAFNSSYANGKNFREREFFILNALAPSLKLSMEMAELPFSVKPDSNVNVLKVIELFRSTYEGTDMDMLKNLKIVKKVKNEDGTFRNDTIPSPVGNPWMTTNALNTYNFLSDNAVTFQRTVSVAWCSYSHVIQLRDWLPDAIGGVCWISVDNPAESPRIPIFCGNSELPEAFNYCGQRKFNENAILWYYRPANKLATLSWKNTRQDIEKNIAHFEQKLINDLPALEKSVVEMNGKSAKINRLLNQYTSDFVEDTRVCWKNMEEKFWVRFGLGF